MMSERERLLLGEIESRLSREDPDLVRRLEATAPWKETVAWRPPRVATGVALSVVAGAVLMVTLITASMHAGRGTGAPPGRPEQTPAPLPASRVDLPASGPDTETLEAP